MAKSTLNSIEFIQRTFSPFVAVLSSPLVEDICQKNNLTFIELLEPFCVINKDVCYKDPAGNIITVKNLQIVLCDVNSKPPEPAIARRLLNESVSSTSGENVETVTVKSGDMSVQIPSTIPWFEKWRETFLKVQFPSDHEFTKYYLACMIVISSQDDNPMDTLSNKVQQLQQMLSMSPPKMMPKWFSSSILRYYILLHDILTGDMMKAEKVYDEMKSTYNANCCYMLKINSLQKGMGEIKLLRYWKKFSEEENFQELSNSASATNSFIAQDNDLTTIETGQEVLERSHSEVIIHPLSPELESQRIFNNNYSGTDVSGLIDASSQFQPMEIYLSLEDIDHIRTLISNFVINALIPFVEIQMQYLNEMVFNKKGVSKSLFSVPRRWFGGPKPGSPVSFPNTHYYHPDSPELQMRRLGDLCFMFCAYNSAFQAYHSVKRDFSNDGAWLYYAGALEMAALSAFLIGQDIKRAQEYTEESVITYLHTCRMPQFATRLTLCATECLKHINMYGEAAGRLLQMTSEDSDLRSALLLEEASYCFIKSRKPPMPRKYAFHLVLAGHRFSKAGQKKHSLRCYRQAYQVYQNKNWSLAEDHIHFTIGKLASALKQKEVTATEYAKLFTRPSTQLPAQQASFLKEYFLSLIELQKENSGDLPFLEVPQVNHSSITVALNSFENEEIVDGYVLAGKYMSEEELSDKRWWKLEENLVSYSISSLPIFFKPTLRVFSCNTNNSVKPTCVVGEQIRTSVDLVNILNIPYSLRKVELIWDHSSQLDDPTIPKIQLAETEIIDSVSLDPDSSSKLLLHIVPKMAGELHIRGIMYTVVLQSSSEGAENISITAHTLLTPQGMRIVSTKKQNEVPVYLPDYRLQLVAVNNAPRLKVYFKNLPSEMLCGEVKEVYIKLKNVGSLPIKAVYFTSSEASSFSVPLCSVKNQAFSLLNDPLLPGHSIEVTIFLRGCDKSGRMSVDLLFYYDAEKSSQKKLNYRLIYHTMHLLIHESLFSSATVSRSIKLTNDDAEVINIKLQVQNKNQIYDSINFTIFLHQISLFSSCWQIYDVTFSSNGIAVSLEQEQIAFIILKARRLKDDELYSDFVLSTSDNSVSSVSKPFNDFTQCVINNKLLKNSAESHDKNNTNLIQNNDAEVAVALNSVLILFWKAEIKNSDKSLLVSGQHHLPLLKFGQKYTSSETIINVNKTEQSINPSNSCIPSSISNLCYNSSATKELVLVKMKHPPFVSHSFSFNRICSIPIELVIQNCCDDLIEIKLNTNYPTSNNLNKMNESSTFLWLGIVLHTFTVQPHSSTRTPLTVCVGNTGTYDLGSQLDVFARKFNTDIFVPQPLISHCLLCVSNDVL